MDWCWLVKDANGGLKVTKTEIGVIPLCFDKTALLGWDVWEHSYYIEFGNKRPAYLSNFRDNLVNWENSPQGCEQPLRQNPVALSLTRRAVLFCVIGIEDACLEPNVKVAKGDWMLLSLLM